MPDATPPNDRSALADSEIIAAVLQGDARAERMLYDAHVDRVYRLAWRMAGDETLARDFTQDTFIRAFERLGDFRGQSSLSTWLHSIAVSVCLNGLKKVKRIHGREMGGDELPEVAITKREAEPDLKVRLRRAIDGLPTGYRTVFVLHDVEGYTHEEIGLALGIQPGTSKAQLFRARARLRTELAEFAGEWAS
ncbi:MAG TPA: RNA polymerase sigma factor [Gemmatimonadaceae bacterium]|nr:RNA polymerase sigma factor [Gemmatimonadaceae bacterium]